MSLWNRQPFVAIRVLGTNGQYPHFDVTTPTHLYVAAPDLVWSAVIQRPLPAEWDFGESAALLPEEVRLLSAIALSERDLWAKGLPLIAHHATVQHDLSGIGFDLDEPEARARVEAIARELGAGLLIGSESYRLRDGLGSRDDAMALLAGIDSTDQLLLAGLARLLGATRVMLANEPEEAAISLFISMGAAMEFIRLQLASEAGADVPFSAVHDYFRKVFPHGSEVVEYFEVRYEERLMATHPANRFGEFWAPPLMMGDVYHLQKSLIGLYRHIVLGETEGW